MDWNWGLRAMVFDQGISVECGMGNGAFSLVISSHPCLSVPIVSFSNALPLHTHHSHCIGTFYGIFTVWDINMERFFTF